MAKLKGGWICHDLKALRRGFIAGDVGLGYGLGSQYCKGESAPDADVKVRCGLHMLHMRSTAMGEAAFL